MITKDEARVLEVGDIIELTGKAPDGGRRSIEPSVREVPFGGLINKLGARFEIVSLVSELEPLWKAKQITGPDVKTYLYTVSYIWIVWHSKMDEKASNGIDTCPLCGSPGFDLCFAFKCNNKQCINSR
jgi:hypothetical protein